MKTEFTLNEHIDFDKLVDSMQVDSGTTIATLKVDGYAITIETQGHVRVMFNPNPSGNAKDGASYRCPSDFPDALKKYFSQERLHLDTPKNIRIDENNWFEVIVEKDGKFLWSDAAELYECTPDEIFSYLWSIYKEETKPVAEPGTVIHGTLRNQDLIPAFLDKLATFNNKRMRSFLFNNPALEEAVRMLNDGKKSDYWETAEATDTCNDLIDILDEYAPEGYSFGAHPGDGSDFGYWEYE